MIGEPTATPALLSIIDSLATLREWSVGMPDHAISCGHTQGRHGICKVDKTNLPSYGSFPERGGKGGCASHTYAHYGTPQPLEARSLELKKPDGSALS